MAHLILRFWDPGSGRITLAGHDLRDYRLDDLRRHVALVAQDTYLFNASLGENIGIAKPEATAAEVNEAVRRAALADFIAANTPGKWNRAFNRFFIDVEAPNG